MLLRKQTDLLLNVLAPLLIGAAIYFTHNYITYPAFIKSHLADGLWAYAFASCLLIIWDRAINFYWLIAALLIAVAFELLQYLAILPGTGDIMDVLTYTLCFSLALCWNKYFKNCYTLKKIVHDIQ